MLLILAGISLNYVLGNNGIIAKAEGAKQKRRLQVKRKKLIYQLRVHKQVVIKEL